jgi:hypothetical protein
MPLPVQLLGMFRACVLKSTEVHISFEQAIFQTSGDDYYVKVAHGAKEACQLVETSFEYICENNGLRFFRKPK